MLCLKAYQSQGLAQYQTGAWCFWYLVCLCLYIYNISTKRILLFIHTHTHTTIPLLSHLPQYAKLTNINMIGMRRVAYNFVCASHSIWHGRHYISCHFSSIYRQFWLVCEAKKNTHTLKPLFRRSIAKPILIFVDRCYTNWIGCDLNETFLGNVHSRNHWASLFSIAYTRNSLPGLNWLSFYNKHHGIWCF